MIKSVAAAAMVILCCCGCAATATFSPYPSQMDPYLRDLTSDNRVELSKCFVRESKGRDAALYAMERGRIAQIQGDVDCSIGDYAFAMEKIRLADEKALVSASGVFSQASSIITNDNAIPYTAEGFERVMLHHFQALNYLAKRDLQGAGVEVRRANAEQEEALRRHENELESAREQAQRENVPLEESEDRLAATFAVMDETAAKVKNSFQNAYTFYLSGIVHELLRQPNDAYIDYKRALEILPDNVFLQNDVMRLATALDMQEDVETFKKLFDPERVLSNPAVGPGGQLIVFIEEGLVPRKEEVKIPIPVGKAGVMAIAFPIYRERWYEPMPYSLDAETGVLALSETVCDTQALAVKALKERIPAMVVRQVIRAAAKRIAAHKSKEKFGMLGELGASIYNIVSENADLRSWNTLPARVQVMRTTVPAGKQKLSLQQNGKMIVPLALSIKNGSTTIVRVLRAGSLLKSQVISFP